MHKLTGLYTLFKIAAKKDETPLPGLSFVGQISARNQGIDPELVRTDTSKAVDQLMARFLSGKIKKYDPDKDPVWQSMLGKTAAVLGGATLNLDQLQQGLDDKKQLNAIQQSLPQTSTGLWARQHNAQSGNIRSPYQAAEWFNKLTHMTHQEDLMPGAGSRSQSLNTRQNITNINPNYGAGRGQGQEYDRWSSYRQSR